MVHVIDRFSASTKVVIYSCYFYLKIPVIFGIDMKKDQFVEYLEIFEKNLLIFV